MFPSWDQTGVPGDEALAHFHSSTTSGSASWMRSRIRFSTEPRQSPSSRMRSSIISEAEPVVAEVSSCGTGCPFEVTAAAPLYRRRRGSALAGLPVAADELAAAGGSPLDRVDDVLRVGAG